MTNKADLLIVDLGSQYTQVIRRSLRYLGFHSLITTPSDVLKSINKHKPRGIILSGGSASVYDTDAPAIPPEILKFDIPILGICYGMQWLAHTRDKSSIQKVKEGKSYGPVEVAIGKSQIFRGLKDKIKAWSSHGDSVKYVPEGFKSIASSKEGKVLEAIEDRDNKLYAVQFHPEVEETEDENIILNNFAQSICNCVHNYDPKDVIEEIRTKTKNALGRGKAVIGVSGGVDSTTLAAILLPVLGSKLKAFMIDTGGMRKDEVEKVKVITKRAKINLEVIDKYKNKFINAVGSTILAEEKRAKFREIYGEVFHEVADEFGATHMIQGTLATDLIESGSLGKSTMIKTHHNVDLDLDLKEIAPLADYFKFEVRKMAHEFGLDDLVTKRQPFPGPGLYLRIIGVPATAELLNMVREADHEVMEILQKHNLYEHISQTIVALMGVKTVGVKGDGRVYEYSFVVRTVKTTDFMTVQGYYLPEKVCQEIISALTQYPKIVRVLFDYTPKPPATTEFE